ncbi:MAG: hypothetical protein ACREUU_20980 [Gammaproteobacteria bacterium]
MKKLGEGWFLVMLLAALMLAQMAAAFDPPVFPVGTYSRVVGPITYVMEVMADGAYRINVHDALYVEGRYVASPEAIILTDASGPGACLFPRDPRGIYRWQLYKDELTFATVADPCKERQVMLTGTPWLRR